MLDRTPRVFISYSWSSKDYQLHIIEIATRMRHNGVDVKLDVWDLKEGQDKYTYMESCVTDPLIDRVLIFSDRKYTEKADMRTGGVGDETSIISVEVYGKANQEKIIPVVMERDNNGVEFLPAYLKSRKYVDLSGNHFESGYEQLLRIIFEQPLYRKPELGKPPVWLGEDAPDVLYSLKTDHITHNKAMTLNSVYGFFDDYMGELKRFYKKNIDRNTYMDFFKETLEYRNVFLDYLRKITELPNYGAILAEQFERMHNFTVNAKTFDPRAGSANTNDFDIFKVHIWELFVCTTTFLLYHKSFGELHELLFHTYYLTTSPVGENKLAYSYDHFRYHSNMIEDVIKPGLDGELSRKYTLAGHMLVTEREYGTIYTGKNIANADLFLYQVYNGLGLSPGLYGNPWFPSLYPYANQYDSIWKKLESNKFCRDIMPLFSSDSIADLKERIAKCEHDHHYSYTGDFHWASAILDWIKIEDIATLP